MPILWAAHAHKSSGWPGLLSTPPPSSGAKKSSVSRSCQHHEWCHEAGAVWNTHICNAKSALWQGRRCWRGRELQQGHFWTSDTTMRGCSLESKERAKGGGWKGTQWRKKNKKIQTQISGYPASSGCAQEHNPPYHSLHHAGVKWKITSITLIMPAFLCHRVWAQMPYVISWTSHGLRAGFGDSLDLVCSVHLHPASLGDVLLVWAMLLSFAHFEN